jgi:DNA-binding LytR/AlgR family response regulator
VTRVRIAIVDDRPEDQAELTGLLKRYCAQRRLAAETELFPSAEAMLAAFAPGRFQILFLDIYMGGMSGMDAARRVRRDDPACRLIFFTTSRAFAVESYAVRASYYLTKPIAYDQLCQGMDEACRGLARDAREITVCSGGMKLQVLLSNILFLDCCNEHPQLHCARRVLTLEDRAADLLPLLTEDDRFLCCNRNTAVNLDWVSRALEEDFLLKDGQTVPIRQRGRAAIKKAFLQYSLRDLRKGGAEE